MRIIELTIQQFDDFASKHPLRNYCQSSQYAKLMGELGYSYDYIGYQDESSNIIAASLILYKKLSSFAKYAYAPKGFLIDYYNLDLLKSFIKDISKYCEHHGVVFIKINPEIIIGEINSKNNFEAKYNQNVKIIDDLKNMNFKRRREVAPLEFIMPRISPYINLKKFNQAKLDNDFQSKLELSELKGLNLELVSNREIDIFYEFIKDNTYRKINYYRTMLNSFGNDTVDLFLIKVDYEKCLISARDQYDKELDHNNECNLKIQEDNNEDNLNEKMESDKSLLKYKNDIVEATEGLKTNKFKYIGGILILKYQNRVTIIADGYDDKYRNLFPKYFAYISIIKKFAHDYEYLDLNGLAFDFNHGGIYTEYNDFKLGFNPTIYEFIGEFDLIFNELLFNRLLSKDIINEEFKPSYIVNKIKRTNN